jgi:outer membrane protein TolC
MNFLRLAAAGHVCLLIASAQMLTLKDAVAQIETLNPDVASARLAVLEREANAAAVKAAYQPQANLIVQSAYQTGNLQGIGLIFPGFPSRLGPYRTFNARPQVTQTVLDLTLLSQIRAARANAKVAVAQQAVVRDDLAIAIVTLYLQTLQADSRIAASDARLRTADTILSQARDRESVGTGSKLDVARAVEQLENERIVRTNAARDALVLRTLLAQAIGLSQPPANLGKPSFASSANEPATRPELLVLEQQAKAAQLETEAARRQRYPKVTAFADWGVLGSGPDRAIGTYTIGASITVPLWTGRRIESEIAAATVREDRIRVDQNRTRLRITQERGAAEAELLAARDAFVATRRAADASKQTLDLASLRYQSGLASSVDVQIAQSAFAVSEDQRIRTEYEVLLSEARLAKANGNILAAIR